MKCVNTGPNTTCRACEASNRECTYPPPVASGTPRISSSSSVRSGGGAGGGRDIAPGSVGGGVSAHHGGASGDRSEVCCSLPRLRRFLWALFALAGADLIVQAPKKAKPKKPAPAGGVAPGPGSYQGPKAYREALDAQILTPVLWTQIVCLNCLSLVSLWGL